MKFHSVGVRTNDGQIRIIDQTRIYQGNLALDYRPAENVVVKSVAFVDVDGMVIFEHKLGGLGIRVNAYDTLTISFALDIEINEFAMQVSAE